MRKEIDYIHTLIEDYPKSSKQLNRPFHADAEIIPLANGFLGVSVDAVSEEIDMGLILAPKTLGWMTVTASVSDLAAVGMKTERVSVLMRDSELGTAYAEEFFAGAREACKAYQIQDLEKVIDCGTTKLTACTAYGWSSTKPAMSRMGLQKDDVLFLTGPIGWGNAVALANLAVRPVSGAIADQMDQTYRPQARWQEGEFIKDFANVCIDTSDGLLSTMKWLEILNQKKLHVRYQESLYHPVALQVARQVKVNPWLFMAAQNGEFELLFAVPAAKYEAFKNASAQRGFQFLEIGKVEEGEGLSLAMNDKEVPLELGNLLDMLHDGVDPQKYIQAMLQFAATSGIALKDW